ncbi:3184_t:CDS:2, partial [Racocetra fulgida]
SPLVKRMIDLSKNDDFSSKNFINGNLKTVSYHIKWLHMANDDELDIYIIEFLANNRFNWQQDKENLERKIKDLRDTIYKYNKWRNIRPVINFDEEKAIAEINELSNEDSDDGDEDSDDGDEDSEDGDEDSEEYGKL